MRKTHETSQDGFTFTLGTLLDGGGIDVLDGHRLVLWRAGNQQVSTTISLDGISYVVAPLDPTFRAAMQFPNTIDPVADVESLVQEIEDILSDHCQEVREQDRLSVTAFVLSSWVQEAVPTPPLLNLYGTAGVGTSLVQILRCLCRRPLVVSELTTQDLKTLPSGLNPTLIMTQPRSRVLENLVSCALHPRQAILSGGRLLELRHAAAVCTRAPLSGAAINIALLPSQSPQLRFTEATAQQITERMAPKLLGYRLIHHAMISNSDFDGPEFAPAIRTALRTLGAALEGSHRLQQRLIEALSVANEAEKAEGSEQLAAVVVEALLVLSHEGRTEAFIDEIAELVNAVRLGRHEPLAVSAKKVGLVLRNELGLCPRRKAHGYRLVIDASLQRRLPQLAEAYGVVIQQPAEQSPNVHEVHHVHEVQEAEHPIGSDGAPV